MSLAFEVLSWRMCIPCGHFSHVDTYWAHLCLCTVGSYASLFVCPSAIGSKFTGQIYDVRHIISYITVASAAWTWCTGLICQGVWMGGPKSCFIPIMHTCPHVKTNSMHWPNNSYLDNYAQPSCSRFHTFLTCLTKPILTHVSGKLADGLTSMSSCIFSV